MRLSLGRLVLLLAVEPAASAALKWFGWGCCPRKKEPNVARAQGPELEQLFAEGEQVNGLLAGPPEVVLERGPGMDPTWLARFPLSTRGRHVVDAHGDRFRLRGVNWYGAHMVHHVVGGLDTQRLDVICESIRQLGFNVVRMPFSHVMLRLGGVVASGIDFEKNPELQGLSPLEVLDKVIWCLGKHSIAVVLNSHTTYADWVGGPDSNSLWFDPGNAEYSEEHWMRDWAALAGRYRNFPHVVGVDLRNEVRFCPKPLRFPTEKQSSCFGPSWPKAALKCAERVLAQSPSLLIVVERIVWPAGSLGPYVQALLPRLQGRLVLAVHHYSWMGPGRYLPMGNLVTTGWKGKAKPVLRCCGVLSKKNWGDMCPEELMKQLSGQWGDELKNDVVPVWVSEFGTGPQPGYDLDWFERFVACLGALDADYAYWPLNVGPKPDGGGDEFYGFLGPDWKPKPEGDPRLALMTASGLLPADPQPPDPLPSDPLPSDPLPSDAQGPSTTGEP